MSRRPLALALALAALLPASAFAEDLLQTYELARTGDPQLAAAESGRLAQKEGAVQARAQLLPQINGSASLSRSHFAGQDYDDPTTRSYSASLDQTVFNWSNFANLRGQRALSEAADYDLEAAGDSLVTRTSAAYFNVLVAIETLAAAEAAETALKRQFDYADKRLEVGLAPITDVHEARAQYDSARANTIAQRNALADAYQALTEITGTPIRNLKGLPDDFRPELPAGGDADTWVASAIDNNPALKSLEYQVKSAEQGVSSARGGHYPSLSFGASYGNRDSWGGPAFVPDPTDPTASTRAGEDRSIGLTLTVPIFSGGATQSRVREAIANRDVRQDQLEQQKRAVERNTRNSYQTLVAGISEIEARRLAVVSADAAYDASQVGLEVGTRTVLDVLINQQNLFNARQAYAIAKYNYLQNRLLLEQSAGSLEYNDVQDVNRLLTVDANAQLSTEPATPSGEPQVQ
ncbi:TolC family outer membrane protein [Luteimonas notoginsengisoli]|uniref:TolC family outer membrane protein n=1 Tax=Luteimonas notoginsengisoli TaxID=1578200 RepID=A0ABV7UUA1_9GAMM